MNEVFGADVDERLESRLEAASMVPAPPIAVGRVVEARADRVWDAISARGNLTCVHPFCARNDVERWPGVGARDHVHYHGGLHYRRDCLAWRDGVGYVLEVGPPGAPTATATWTIDPIDAGSCRFAIEVLAWLRADLPPDRLARYRTEVVEGAIPPYLDGVVRGVAYFSETGTPVQRNQFGAHPLYSP